MSEEKQLYLVTEMSKIDSQYDTFYQKIDSEIKTWENVSSLIENELEDQFVSNDGKLEGISFSIKITSELPENIEFDEMDDMK